MSPSHIGIQPQQQPQGLTNNRKRKSLEKFTRNARQRHLTKMSGSCPSKLDGEMLPSRSGI